MKTDLKKLLVALEAGIETLTTDAEEHGQAKDQTTEITRLRSLIGHSISGLRGVAENLKGLAPEPAPAPEK